MNGKILVKGNGSFKSITIACFVIAAIAFVACFGVATVVGGSPAWAFEGIEYGYYWFFIGIAIFIILGLIFAAMSFEIIVTEDKVTGKTFFRKRVDLPISQISATGTGAFSSVAIATSSGSIKFFGISNREEIFNCLSELLTKRQNETRINTSGEPKSNADELKKYKELLDQGIITQDEFDAKKKELLGL